MRKFAEAMPIMAWTSSADLSSSYFNRRWSDFTGLEQTGCSEDNWLSTLHPDDIPTVTARWRESVQLGIGAEKECRVWSTQHRCFRWQLLRWEPIPKDVPDLSGWVGIAIDVHDRKLLEDRFDDEVAGRTSDMRRLLSQKEALLQEVHHRVRNNLQIIASLLAMQLTSLEDETTADILRESERRIYSIVMLYQSLYQGSAIGQLDFSQYVENLVQELLFSYGKGSDHVKATVKTQGISLAIDQAIPCGLILNELVTHSLKSAYRSERNEEVVIDIKETNDHSLEIAIKNSASAPPDAHSLGLDIVTALSKQLDGEFMTQLNGGTTYTVRFPKEETTPSQDAPTTFAAEAR